MTAHVTTDLARRRFTVEEYERMGTTGILGEDDRLELLDGEIVSMTPIGPVHAAVVDRLNELLVLHLGDRANVRVQNPVRIPPWSEPQPDLQLLKRRTDFYQSGHPEPLDVLLAIEVADSSLATDRAIKVPLYAKAGFVEVWIVDLSGRRVIVNREPLDGFYTRIDVARPGDAVSPAAFDDVALTVEEILGV